MQKIRVAAMSPTIVPGDKGANLASARRGMEAARQAGVELAVFSEWYLTHCVDQQSYAVAEPVPDGPTVQETIRFARELGITVAMGIEELDPQRGVVYNTHFLCGPEGYIGKHLDGINMVVADLDPACYAARRTDANYPIKKRRPERYGPIVEPY